MRFASYLSVASALAGISQAAVLPKEAAIVIVEASHGGAGNALANTTLVVPFNKPYHNKALDAVSTLYLEGVEGCLDMSKIQCIPYAAKNGKGSHGQPFSNDVPSLLSTNTVVIGSVVCKII